MRKTRPKEVLRYAERRRRGQEEGDIETENRDCSDDESRHVSPLNRVFLGFERAAAAAGIEFRCGLSLRRVATGGKALINTDCPSLTAGRSFSLMVLGAPALSLLPEERID